MRIARRALKVVQWRARTVTKTEEGASVETYSPAIPFYAAVWQASGHVDALLYGERLAYTYHMEYDGPLPLEHNDGICLFVGPDKGPDYKITSINRDHHPQTFILERLTT